MGTSAVAILLTHVTRVVLHDLHDRFDSKQKASTNTPGNYVCMYVCNLCKGSNQ